MSSKQVAENQTVRFMLDTNICIYLMKGKIASVQRHFAALQAHEVGISVITQGEIYFGASKSQQRALAFNALQALCLTMRVLDLDASVAHHYGEIRASLETKGKPIGANDLWIAAHARALGLTLVSNNLREFSRVPGLTVANWVD
jgi:tRNA(fMet)-specific endonuclease VapC